MAIADVLEGIGSGIDPSYANNPYIPGVGAVAAGALTGFAAGRSARRRLARASKARELEEKLGFPLDVFTRLSNGAQTSILKSKGLLGPDGTMKSLESLGGFSLDEIMNQGVPARTVMGEEPISGPLMPGQERPQIPTPKRTAAVPPLSTVRKEDLPFYFSQLNPDIPQPESPSDVALRRERTARAAGLEATLPYQGLQAQATLEQTRASTEHLTALSEQSKQARRLAQESSKTRPVPQELVDTLRRNGVQIPQGSSPSYQELDYYMKGSFAWGELQRLVEEYSGAFIDRLEQGKAVSKADINAFIDANLKGQLDLIGGRMTRNDPGLARKLFVQQLLDRIEGYRATISNQPPPGAILDQPYTVPGKSTE